MRGPVVRRGSLTGRAPLGLFPAQSLPSLPRISSCRRRRRRDIAAAARSSSPFAAAVPSWDDEWSETEVLSDVVEADYAPDMIEDSNFNGLAVGCTEVCRGHKLMPQRCVAFGGSDTGRRFHMCSVANQVNNCGFVSWVDGEWPPSMKHAICRLWQMYEESNSGRIGDKIKNVKMFEELSIEKNKAEKDYARLMADVKKFVEDTEKRVLAENYKKIMANTEDELEELKKEVSILRGELLMRKNVHMTQAEVMKNKQKQWDEEKDTLKEEKKNLEYMIFDLLKVSDANKEKLKTIKSIYDE